MLRQLAAYCKKALDVLAWEIGRTSSGQPAAASCWELCSFQALRTYNQLPALHTAAGDNELSVAHADAGWSAEPAVECSKDLAVYLDQAT